MTELFKSGRQADARQRLCAIAGAAYRAITDVIMVIS
jgi:hypothetical protein